MKVPKVTKICTNCKEEKDILLFHVNNSRVDGFSYWCKDCNNAVNKINKHKKRYAVLSHYSNKSIPECDCCGEDALEFLTLDHINGDGAEHRKQINSVGGTSTYAWLIKNSFPEGFRVLCWNCNCSFGHYGYCPHDR